MSSFAASKPDSIEVGRNSAVHDLRTDNGPQGAWRRARLKMASRRQCTGGHAEQGKSSTREIRVVHESQRGEVEINARDES